MLWNCLQKCSKIIENIWIKRFNQFIYYLVDLKHYLTQFRGAKINQKIVSIKYSQEPNSNQLKSTKI